MLYAQKTTRITAMLAGVAMLAMTVVACSTTGGKRISGTTSSMADIEALTDQGEARLDAVMASINGLDKAEDLGRASRDLRANTRALEETSKRIRERRMAMETRAAEHAALWRSESAHLSGDRAQRISDQRRSEFEKAVADVGDELDQLRAAYDPFIAKLHDLQVMLENDLTRQGVKHTEPIRQGLAEMADGLRQHGADTRAALGRAQNEFSQ